MLVATVWFGSAATGLWVLWAYENQPGASAHALAQWPADSGLAHQTDRPTLVMLVHPQCVCSRASLTELAEILARARTRPKTYVLFLKPRGFRRRLGEDRHVARRRGPARRHRRARRRRRDGRTVRRGDLRPDFRVRRRAAGWSSAAASPARAATPGTTPAGRRCVALLNRQDVRADERDQRIRLLPVRAGHRRGAQSK